MSLRVNDISERSGFALVIGGGGAVAAASCSGALKALSEVAGINPADAKVIIGTSAGAALGAEIRAGKTVDEMIDTLRSAEGAKFRQAMSTTWTSKPDLLRHLVGSSWIMARSAFPGVWRMGQPLQRVQRAFPGSMISIPTEHWAARYPEWPERDLWLIASDLDSGRRVILKGGWHEGARVPLSRAIMASCAVPGVYAPVRVGKRRLVDGGVQSATNLDVAAESGCRSVIALAPMGYDRREPPGYVRAMGRVRSNSKLDREVASVRRKGMAVLTVRPGAEELRHHKFNILSSEANEAIMAAAYEMTARRLSAGAGERVLDDIRADAATAAG